MPDEKIVPFRSGAQRRRDDRAARWPTQLLVMVGLLGFVCGVLYMSAPL